MTYRHTEDVIRRFGVVEATTPQGEPLTRTRSRRRKDPDTGEMVARPETTRVVLGERHKLALVAMCFNSPPCGYPVCLGPDEIAAAAIVTVGRAKELRRDLHDAGVLVYLGIGYYNAANKLEVIETAKQRFGRGRFPAFLINTDRLFALLAPNTGAQKGMAEASLFDEKRLAQAEDLTKQKESAQGGRLSSSKRLSGGPSNEKGLADGPKADGPGRPQYLMEESHARAREGRPVNGEAGAVDPHVAELARAAQAEGHGPMERAWLKGATMFERADGCVLVAKSALSAERLEEGLGLDWLRKHGVVEVVAAVGEADRGGEARA